MGNVHGRVHGRNASAEALLIGSHLVKLLTFVLLFDFKFHKPMQPYKEYTLYNTDMHCIK